MISTATTSDDIEFEGEKEVLVFHGEHEGVSQPQTFRLCPLGVQLYTSEPVEECSLIDLRVALPTENGEGEEHVNCTGLVAQCLPSQNGTTLYRVWVKFLDLTPETADRIRVLTADCKFSCPFCLNF